MNREEYAEKHRRRTAAKGRRARPQGHTARRTTGGGPEAVQPALRAPVGRVVRLTAKPARPRGRATKRQREFMGSLVFSALLAGSARRRDREERERAELPAAEVLGLVDSGV